MNVYFGSGVLIIVGEVLVLGGVIAVLILSRRRSKKVQELRQEIASTLRENALADELKNTYASDEKIEELKKSEPTKVTFHDQEDITPRGVILQICVMAPLSTRFYIFDIKDKIIIGGSERNHLVLEDAGVEDILCHLIMQNGRIYIKRISEGGSLGVIRDGRSLSFGDQLLALTDGDLIMAGKDRLELRFVTEGV
ncbi:MAG: hypothetical protein IIT72_09145 [Lachnospiraceae bacterium]|nr:hypothetical protein [Lachnospiraceae bacterium]